MFSYRKCTFLTDIKIPFLAISQIMKSRGVAQSSNYHFKQFCFLFLIHLLSPSLFTVCQFHGDDDCRDGPAAANGRCRSRRRSAELWSLPRSPFSTKIATAECSNSVTSTISTCHHHHLRPNVLASCQTLLARFRQEQHHVLQVEPRSNGHRQRNPLCGGEHPADQAEKTLGAH